MVVFGFTFFFFFLFYKIGLDTIRWIKIYHGRHAFFKSPCLSRNNKKREFKSHFFFCQRCCAKKEK